MAISDDPRDFLHATRTIERDHPSVRTFAAEAVGGARSARERAILLFEAVRDGLRYDPWQVQTELDDYRASRILERDGTWCVPKAVVLTAAARSVGVPTRLGFADVRNHLATDKLLAILGTDLFIFHGYVEFHLDDRWVKATPAFNRELCERFGVAPLRFDGVNDALLHEFDGEGRAYMEYVHDRGPYTDVPLEEFLSVFRSTYGDESPLLATAGSGQV
jgi:transglutaminase-like putative cysteine protease